MGIWASIRAALSKLAGKMGLTDFWEGLQRYDTWQSWASDIWSGTVDGVKDVCTLPARAPVKGMELGLAGADKSWSYMKTNAPRTVGAVKWTGGALKSTLRALSGGGGAGNYSVPAPMRTPTKTMNAKPAAQTPASEIPIQGADKLVCVIEHLRANPDDRKKHRLAGLDKFEKAVYFGAFTDGHSADRMKQLAGMKDHEILQLFKKTVKDERSRLNEQNRTAKKAAKVSPTIKTGGLHAGDIKELAGRLDQQPPKKSNTPKGEVVQMPKKAAMTTASTSSVFGAEYMAQVSERTRKMVADRQISFIPEETENPAAGMTPAM